MLATDDFDVANTANLVQFRRTYNSFSQARRDLGTGWQQSLGYDVRLEPEPDGGYAFVDDTGYRERFVPDGAGGLEPDDASLDQLTVSGPACKSPRTAVTCTTSTRAGRLPPTTTSTAVA